MGIMLVSPLHLGKIEHTLFCYGRVRADIYGAYFWLNSFESCSCAFSTSLNGVLR